MKISCIVAAGNNNVIGNDNDIPWYLPADLQYFKKITLGHHIIMGRNCFESIGKPLPKRTNIVLTRDPFYIASNCLIAHSIPEALAMAHENGEEEAFIIGGGKIYQQSQELWDDLYFTKVDVEVEGNVYFPELDMNEWKLVSEDQHLPDEKNKYSYNFQKYERKND